MVANDMILTNGNAKEEEYWKIREWLQTTIFLPMEMQRKRNNEKLWNGCKCQDFYKWKCKGRGIMKNYGMVANVKIFTNENAKEEE